MTAPRRAATLIVFARRPRAGAVKRRLARTLGGRRAARVYAQLLLRTLTLAAGAGYERLLLMPAAAGDRAWFCRRYARRGWRVRAQCAGDLGQRMAAALAGELAAGRCAVLIGSDIADGQVSDLRAARRALIEARADAVLGPVADGGYWLLGLSRETAGLFDAMHWSTATVAADTRRRLDLAGQRTLTLPCRHDVDSARDLRWMRGARGRR